MWWKWNNHSHPDGMAFPNTKEVPKLTPRADPHPMLKGDGRCRPPISAPLVLEGFVSELASRIGFEETKRAAAGP